MSPRPTMFLAVALFVLSHHAASADVDINRLSQTVDSLAVNQDIIFGALTKILKINTLIYDVSKLYDEKLYIASKVAQPFDLEKMNELCKASNGYLAEVGSEDELEALEEFVQDIGQNYYAIGGNDVENEGQFVYYNSKKPMPNGLWKRGEPNNWGGNENCVNVTPWGLNDFRCGHTSKYICEINLY